MNKSWEFNFVCTFDYEKNDRGRQPVAQKVRDNFFSFKMVD